MTLGITNSFLGTVASSGGAGFLLTWSPVPAGSPFTTGLYEGVTFTASATITVDGGPKDFEYLVVAGGGGGAAPYGGGGGAGGYRSSVPGENSGGGSTAESVLNLGAGNYTVTVGAGGAIGPVGSDGTPSVFDSIVSVGGGGGGSFGTGGRPGGSGGGARYGPAPTAGGAGTPGQGFRGGNAQLISPLNRGTGGGGAGSAGVDLPSTPSPSTNPSPGGDGVTSAIGGSSVLRAGGGAGGGQGPTQGTSPVPNASNLGAGGRAAFSPIATPALAGGSGVVIIRWLA